MSGMGLPSTEDLFRIFATDAVWQPPQLKYQKLGTSRRTYRDGWGHTKKGFKPKQNPPNAGRRHFMRARAARLQLIGKGEQL